MHRLLSLSKNNPAPELPPRTMRALVAIEPEGPHGAIRSLDTLPASSRRVVAELGLRGGDKFLVLTDVSPVAPGPTPRVYPDAATPRVVARGERLQLTPGHTLGIEIVAIPSGPTQVSDGSAGWLEGTRTGAVRLTVTYRNGDGDTQVDVATIEVGGSAEALGAESPNVYEELVIKQNVTSPLPLQPSTDEAERYMRGGDVVADWTLEVVGSLRAIDLVVVEVPLEIVVELVADEWPTAMYSEDGDPYEELPTEYPVEQIASDDPGGGARSIRRAQLQHGLQLGPILAEYSVATEHVGTLADWISYGGGVGDDEAPGVGATGTSELLVPFLTAPDVDAPASCPGHYGRQVDAGDDFLDERTGVLPVWVVAYVKGDAAVFSLRSGDPTAPQWSAIEWTSTSGVWEWVVIPGWLEVGTGSEDAPPLRLFGRETVAPNAEPWLVRYLGVFQVT